MAGLIADEETLLSLIATEVESANGTPLDAGEVAARLVAILSREELERLAFKATRREVVNYIASLRPPANGRNRSLRYETVAEGLDDLERFRLSFENGKSNGILHCTADELDARAEWYEKRVEGYTKRAAQYRELAKKVRRARVVTAAELPEETVRKILDA